jgi:hypothetical protein
MSYLDSLDSLVMHGIVSSESDTHYSEKKLTLSPFLYTEKIVLTDMLTKINKRGKKQTRILVVTDRALYNFKPDYYKAFQRRIETW